MRRRQLRKGPGVLRAASPPRTRETIWRRCGSPARFGGGGKTHSQQPGEMLRKTQITTHRISAGGSCVGEELKERIAGFVPHHVVRLAALERVPGLHLPPPAVEPAVPRRLLDPDPLRDVRGEHNPGALRVEGVHLLHQVAHRFRLLLVQPRGAAAAGRVPLVALRLDPARGKRSEQSAPVET